MEKHKILGERGREPQQPPSTSMQPKIPKIFQNMTKLFHILATKLLRQSSRSPIHHRRPLPSYNPQSPQKKGRGNSWQGQWPLMALQIRKKRSLDVLSKVIL